MILTAFTPETSLNPSLARGAEDNGSRCPHRADILTVANIVGSSSTGSPNWIAVRLDNLQMQFYFEPHTVWGNGSADVALKIYMAQNWLIERMRVSMSCLPGNMLSSNRRVTSGGSEKGDIQYLENLNQCCKCDEPYQVRDPKKPSRSPIFLVKSWVSCHGVWDRAYFISTEFRKVFHIIWEAPRSRWALESWPSGSLTRVPKGRAAYSWQATVEFVGFPWFCAAARIRHPAL